MTDFSRGIAVGLLTAIAVICFMLMAVDMASAADGSTPNTVTKAPIDLVGFTTNEMGKPVFLTTWPASPAGAKYAVKCEAPWHFTVSVRPVSEKNPEGDLFGCWVFTKPQEITIGWNDKGKPLKIVYPADVFDFTDWFLALYPAHGPDAGAPDTEPETGQPDTKL